MATIVPVGQWIGKHVHQTQWSSMASGDVGAAASTSRLPDKTVTIDGTFGTGTTIIIEGSNDGTNYHQMVDPQGNNLSFTSGGVAIETLLENPRYLRPRITAGASVALTVTLIEQGGN